MRTPQEKRARYKICWTRVLFLFTVLIVVLASAAGAAYYAANKFFVTPVTAANEQALPDQVVGDSLNKKINILLLGLDDGDMDDPSLPNRSDTMIVASIDPEKGTVNLLSIPRDTRVNIPGHKGLDKINNAYFFGGSTLAVRTVENFLNIPIQYNVAIKWQGFIKVVDILGGVDLYVEHDMAYEDPYANLSINLHKGYQHLDGQQAGEYVRFRHDELGDIGRVQRQQKFLKALSDQFLQFSTLIKIPALVTAIDQNIVTNMSGYTFLRVANTLRGIKSGTMSTDMLPGDFVTIRDISYWEPNKEQVKQVVDKMFNPRTPTVSQKGY
jgi:LCP family protein required for cell wall assembly